MFSVRSPALTLIYAAYGLVALMAGIIVLALSMPSSGVAFSQSGSVIQMRVAGRPAASLSPRAIVTLRVGDDRLTAPADELVADFMPTGTHAQIAQWYAARSRLVRMGATRRMTIDAPEAGVTGVLLQSRKRGLGDLSSDVWLLLLQGAVIGLLGVGIVALRPADRASQIFAVSCGGVVLSAFSGAVFDARELTANGDLLRFAQGLNFIGANLCAAGLLALFLAQPKPLLGTVAPFVLLTLAVASGVVSALGLAPLSLFYGGLALVLPAYPVVLLAQWLAARSDPAARSVIRWVGVTVFSGSAILTIAMTAPQFLGTPPVAGDGLSIVPVFIVYGGIAFGVARFRLFDLDVWAIRLSAGAIGALALLASDAVLILVLGVATPEAFALSVLFVGFLYFPVRHYVWRWLGPRPPLSDSELFQAAADVAFTRNPAERQSRWRALLSRLFNPLDVSPGEPVESPGLIEGGLAMALPAAADDLPLVLRYRDQGRKLFDPSQIRLAAELIQLMRRAEQTRDDYTRGALEERRICRPITPSDGRPRPA
jgi:two-component system sensor histidine kinase DevS